MKKVMLLAILLILPLVSAAATQITVKTFKFQEVNIFVLDGSQNYFLVDSFKPQNSGAAGEVTVTTNTELPSIDILVVIKDNGVKVLSKRFEDYSTGAPIVLELPDMGGTKTDEPTNQTVVNETSANQTTNSTNETAAPPAPASPAQEKVTDVVADAKPTVTGNALSDTGSSSFKMQYLYYIFGVIVLAGILFFIFRARGKYSQPKFNFRPPSKGEAAQVMHLQRKLQDAEREIHVLKNQDKVKSMEKRIEEEKREIERLKRGEI
jgi:hypothetical protein